MKPSQLLKTVDWTLGLSTLLLLVAGITVIFGLTGESENKIYLNQIVFASIGIVLMAAATFIDYRVWKNVSWLAYFGGIICLILVFIFGSYTFGARRWIDFGVFQFQPSELMKPILIITLARYFSNVSDFSWKRFIVCLLIVSLPVFLIIKQPDLGSASVLMLTSLVLLAVAKIPKIYYISLMVLVLVAFPAAYANLQPYQRQRLTAFANPTSDLAGSGYNVAQSKIAIGSGGIFGRGLGKGSQSQLQFLPVAHADFIFAGLAEATGFVGSIGLLLVSAIVVVRSFQIAKLSQDKFGMYIAFGISVQLMYQIFINAGGNLGIVPVTGIPYPLVSSGGTALVVVLMEIGILESIYLRHKKIRF